MDALFSGIVEQGKHLGRRLGFPTANIRLDDPEASLVVNGVKAEEEATKDPFVKKIGPYLPGAYTVTIVHSNGKKKTIRVELFGGARVHEVDITK